MPGRTRGSRRAGRLDRCRKSRAAHRAPASKESVRWPWCARATGTARPGAAELSRATASRHTSPSRQRTPQSRRRPARSARACYPMTSRLPPKPDVGSESVRVACPKPRKVHSEARRIRMMLRLRRCRSRNRQDHRPVPPRTSAPGWPRSASSPSMYVGTRSP